MIGRVLGTLTLKTVLPGAESLRWMQVCVGDGVLEAVDLIGACPGDLVLLCRGSAGWRLVPECPAEQMIVAVLQENEKDG